MTCADTFIANIEKMAKNFAIGHMGPDFEQLVDPINFAKLYDTSIVHAKMKREALKHIPPPIIKGFRLPKREKQ
jgi:hypothetical protein